MKKNSVNIILKEDLVIKNCNHFFSCAVLLSTYNGEKYIKEQLNSLISQRNVNLHIFIRDDGSIDSTLEILKEYKRNNPEIIDVLEGTNCGIHKSFWNLFNSVPSNYDYYAFCDQDDIWDDDKLITAISCLSKFNSDFYASSSRLIDSTGVSLNRTTAAHKEVSFYMNGPHSLFTPGVQGCTMVFSNKLFSFLKSIGFPSNIGHDTWIPIISYYFFISVYDCNPHMSYRQHEKSWTGNRKSKIKYLFTSYKQFKNGLIRYSIISDMILNKCRSFLEKEKIEYLENFTAKMNFIQRVRSLSKYGYRKKRILETIIIRIKYLAGKFMREEYDRS